jgi:hypothetical protein
MLLLIASGISGTLPIPGSGTITPPRKAVLIAGAVSETGYPGVISLTDTFAKLA